MVTWCSPDCGYKLSQIKLEKKRTKDNIKKKKDFKDNDLPNQLKLTEKDVNKLVRLRDIDLPCISCGTTNDVVYACGHYLSKGAFNETRYNFKNMNKQCNKYCNSALSGNIEGNKTTRGYKAGVLERFGKERLEWLEGPHERIKYKCHDLIEFRKEVNQIIRDMEKGGEFRVPSMYQDN